MPSNSPLFPGFLNDPDVYDAAVAYWRTLCDRVLAASGATGWNFRGPRRFIDGTIDRDGNPMFDLSHEGTAKAVRLIQREAMPDDREFLWGYMDTRGEDDAMREIVLPCVLTERTAEIVAALMAKWILPHTTVDEMRKQIDILIGNSS